MGLSSISEKNTDTTWTVGTLNTTNVTNFTNYTYFFTAQNSTTTESTDMQTNTFNVTPEDSVTLAPYDKTNGIYHVNLTGRTCNPEYDDVLLVYLNNSNLSRNVAQYFINKRGVCNILETWLPIVNKPLRFAELNQTVYQDIRNYISSINESNYTNATISFIVLSDDFPTYTSEPTYGDADVSSLGQAHSPDAEISLLMSANDPLIYYPLHNYGLTNNYYNASAWYTSLFHTKNVNGLIPFNRSNFDMFIVSRLDGVNESMVQSTIDSANNFTKASRTSGMSLYVDYNQLFTSAITIANASLSNVGIIPAAMNNSVSGVATIPCVDYSNISFAIYYRDYSFSPTCFANISYNPGAIGHIYYSYAAQNMHPTLPYNVNMMTSIALSQGSTFSYGSSREPFSSGSIQHQYLGINFVRDGTFYSEMEYNSLPYNAWTSVFVGDPKAMYPLVVNNITNTSSSLSGSIYVNHPPTYNETPYTIENIWHINGVLNSVENITNAGISTVYNISLVNASVPYIYNVSLTSVLYKNGVDAGVYSVYNLSNQRRTFTGFVCNHLRCWDFVTNENVSYQR